MPRIKLTKNSIDTLPTLQTDVVYWDAGCPGFGVKVTPKGRKVFVVLYRTGGAAPSYASIPSVLTGGSRCTRRALPLRTCLRRRSVQPDLAGQYKEAKRPAVA